MQGALVFLGVVLAVVILGWLQQRQEISSLRSDLEGATSALSVDPDSVVRVETSMEIVEFPRFAGHAGAFAV